MMIIIKIIYNLILIMFINSYLIAFFSGIFIYLIMVIDSIYISHQTEDSTKNGSSKESRPHFKKCK